MEEKVKLPENAFEPVGKNDGLDDEKIAAPSRTFLQDAWRRLKENKAAFISLWILVIIGLFAFTSPLTAPNPNNSNPNYANLPPKIPGVHINGFNGTSIQGGARVDQYKANNVPSNKYYILGTDYLGRSLGQRILHGTMISLMIGLFATLIDLLIGVGYGIFSAWKGGRVDIFMQRVIEIMSSIPNIVIMVLLLLVLKGGMLPIILAIVINEWTTMARLTRAQTLQLKSQEYVLAAQTLGESSWKIAVKHLLPNLSSVIIIQTMFTIPTAIFFEAFLSYIGIGIQAPTASLGTLINDGQRNFQFLPFQMWYPAIVLAIIMIAFNILADGLRDAFDPRTARR
ncbi:ABC transporter permease [Pediococcus claussenii]|uniref:Oligopeptide/dipeptide ABC transporter, permease protein OppC n=1 Tax=Pediococcus claussenii (strain ATCC BAA-344 / DSM 14800 / JCM 18046 / KCTC 3811 / LMG 21948 / P06) TaxID=701521 RepID=G8PEX2_PEDCP|nr:ABC transporter permease [Pediococcus claussenii]AEV95651.1 oligopeptide/dipeptide ABC transporter, permease protein OppC [Pediococcus claussenii ATCC BAA-344]ANZ69169.1 peptide ABC transporter permease [Pediococcus claussenii]ANZ70986.1 peptide ABC transporter permease [Pediococcus claussenii]KRN20116.1 oppC protein [Pediococcus claussenii]